MGYLLKEALKTLCGVNTWSYAVFWKISCQNTKLLIWEDCYYEPALYSAIHGIPGSLNPDMAFQNWSSCWAPNAVSCEQSGENVQLLVNKMMAENQFNVVGEGVVGRAAVTGNHQWILWDGYCKEAHPIEVLKELTLQFSAGMKTIAVIPVLPHGVVQLGSYKLMMENAGVVNDVKMLLCQLGCVSDEQAMKRPVQNAISRSFADYHDNVCQANVVPLMNLSISPKNHLRKEMMKAEAIPSNPHTWLNQHSSTYIQRPTLHEPNALVAGHSTPHSSGMDAGLMIPHIDSNSLLDGNTSLGMVENDLFQELGTVVRQNNENPSLSEHILDFSYAGEDEYAVHSAMLDDSYEEPHFHQSGEDLFDVLGSDFKNKLLNGSGNNFTITKEMDHNLSNSGIFSPTDFNNLLDFATMTHSAKQNLDDNVSCHTTLTTTSSSSGANASCSFGRVGRSTQMQGEIFGCPNPQTSSIYGSQVSSWVDQACDMKKTTSVSTVSSKKPDESSKPIRKRLKPGENPRPRPKDRQMIQDRVKELREIVPNGAKCSIDALLERTIKHMLFLQSVTKHADKLKQTGESKIIGTEGGLHRKGNFEGGATWAYEIGSESTVCPIIVEDLNEPRQMLVEMLCEQRGFFLEIADIIRGLGLTILKGVMEMKNEKIWARFAVEAKKDITRVEIFMSLVHLFEQTTKSGTDNEEVKSHQFQ